MIDHGSITAPPDKGETRAVAAYGIAAGKVVRVTFLEKAPLRPDNLPKPTPLRGRR